MVDSTDKNSLVKIVKTIDSANLSEIEKSLFVSECYVQKLMMSKMSFVSSSILKFVYKMKGYDAVCNALAVSILPDIDTCFAGILHHILHGKDSTNVESAGGFNQEELYILKSILTHYKVYI